MYGSDDHPEWRPGSFWWRSSTMSSPCRCEEEGVTTDTASTRRLRAELVRALIEASMLPSPEWERAFARVPCHLLVPSFLRDADLSWELVDSTRPEHHDDWLAAVYSDDLLFIQRDTDDPMICSSSSMPSVMAQMLDALRVSQGDRVLEIGTGSGYNAALLCERLGSDRVTTVDIDAGLADAARERLRLAGYTPTVAVADGFHGHAANAPYDRVISTCRVLQVPSAWIDQTRPGGLVLAMLPPGDGAAHRPRRRFGRGPLPSHRVRLHVHA
jgi:protein-L-isoaspartate O-methyltransferase